MGCVNTTPQDLNTPADPKKRRFQTRVVVLGVITALFVAPYLYRHQTQVAPTELRLDQVMSSIEGGKVSEAKLDDSRRRILIKTADGTESFSGYPDGYGAKLVEKLSAKSIPTTVGEVEQSSVALALLLNFLPILLIGGALFFVSKRIGGGGMRTMAASNRTNPAEIPPARFKDVAGCDEAVEELSEVVAFLQDPERFERLGARVPHGVLLVGPPGTGKTMLARATAGEAGVPFFALSGSDFVEMFVGVGASRVRTLFEKARKAGRAIIFIDEIDAIGKQRSGGFASGANDERESTLNALLVELDGFVESGVVVIAATNRADVLDQALLRPGRFDRRVQVGLPDRKGREELFGMYLGQKKIDDSVDAELLATSLARRSTGMSGADISAVVNEAALMAAKQSDEAGVTELDVHDALERVALGRERRSAEISVRAQEIVAWHEAGHAVVAMCLQDASKPERVSVVPRGGAGGATWFAGDEDEHFVTRSQAVANLAVAYGGRAAEELLLDGDFTQGASGDIAQATSRAERMVFEWGMSSYGMVRVDRDRFMDTDDKARAAVRELLENAIEQAREVLSQNAALFRAVREQLAEKETLSAEDLSAIRAGVVS